MMNINGGNTKGELQQTLNIVQDEYNDIRRWVWVLILKSKPNTDPKYNPNTCLTFLLTLTLKEHVASDRSSWSLNKHL